MVSSAWPIDSDVHTGMGSNMDTHTTMILHMSMGSSMVGMVVLRMGMGNNSMESLWYPRDYNSHHQMHILELWIHQITGQGPPRWGKRLL